MENIESTILILFLNDYSKIMFEWFIYKENDNNNEWPLKRKMLK